MRFQTLIFIFLTSIVMSGCASCEETTLNVNNANSAPVVNSAPENTNRPDIVNDQNNPTENTPEGITPPTPTPIQKVNEAPTIKPLVAAFCKAVNSKNDAELQKVYSKQAWQTMQKYAKDEDFNSVAEFLDDAEPVGTNCQVINEKLTENTGVAVVTTKTYPNGVELKFVKEGNDWKMTTQTTEFN